MNLVKDEWLSKELGLNAFNLRNLNLLNNNFFKKKNLFITAKIKKKNQLKNKYLKKYFKFIDFNIQFRAKFSFNKNFKLKNNDISFRFANKNDKKKIVSISNNALKFSRFRLDTRIPKKICKNIQSSWISNYFSGKRGDHLIVAENKKKNICGFLLIISNKKTMKIDLIATSNRFQRKGIATGMISFALKQKFNYTGLIDVGTQKTNLKSINFYKKLGFKKKIVYSIFHYLKKN